MLKHIREYYNLFLDIVESFYNGFNVKTGAEDWLYRKYKRERLLQLIAFLKEESEARKKWPE